MTAAEDTDPTAPVDDPQVRQQAGVRLALLMAVLVAVPWAMQATGPFTVVEAVAVTTPLLVALPLLATWVRDPRPELAQATRGALLLSMLALLVLVVARAVLDRF